MPRAQITENAQYFFSATSPLSIAEVWVDSIHNPPRLRSKFSQIAVATHRGVTTVIGPDCDRNSIAIQSKSDQNPLAIGQSKKKESDDDRDVTHRRAQTHHTR